ncbi:MAG: hypothetical protein H0X02_07450 [Nitrosomonas sp.]|nr:hypothetical protein [Nitrosomonas sp.]
MSPFVPPAILAALTEPFAEIAKVIALPSSLGTSAVTVTTPKAEVATTIPSRVVFALIAAAKLAAVTVSVPTLY